MLDRRSPSRSSLACRVYRALRDIIPAEEQFLATKFGEAYEAYRRRVPHLFPRWEKRMSTEHENLVWKNALGDLRIAAILVMIYGFLRISGWLRG